MSENSPLVLVSDETVLEELLRMAAAAGCELKRVPDATAARPLWQRAPLILLDPAGAQEVQVARLPKRDRIVLISPDTTTIDGWHAAVDLGAEHVVELPAASSWLADAFADAAEGVGPPGRVLAVVGGRGGAGASVFAVAVAKAAAGAGHRAMLVDCDPLAAGLDLVLGAETEQGLRWPDMEVRGRVAASSLRAALPGSTGLKLVSGARKGFAPEPDAVTAVVQAGRRGGDIVVCDLPRELSPAAQAALDLADLTVIVVPAELRACASARIVSSRLKERGVVAQVLVRGPAPGGLTPDEVAKAVELPLLSSMRYQKGLAVALERGHFSDRNGPLIDAARRALESLGVAEAIAS
ncbi:secretion/DNA translocation related CpaE-like protein [Kibdelosporangium banguiense]|uniref:Secretion/DNA translocation related CpaE-like protein n=1 Tax=Kibdelosporangium banguiense TaxID=1365924 RepID=A0ABS4TAJ7_9PSEU|nr:septum site-determining protein Ssd [Kibdelosporangium banguiense]MBP2321432.1 secretion/DNA translocation related CpaE-like protein [Kibdelosporangium banguiense]